LEGRGPYPGACSGKFTTGLLNHFFNHGGFETYWFSTGTFTFLVRLIEKQKIDILNLEKSAFTLAAMQKLNVDNMDALAVLYQAGYLTIVDYDEEFNEYTGLSQ
jgi:hypothetical protein